MSCTQVKLLGYPLPQCFQAACPSFWGESSLFLWKSIFNMWIMITFVNWSISVCRVHRSNYGHPSSSVLSGGTPKRLNWYFKCFFLWLLQIILCPKNKLEDTLYLLLHEFINKKFRDSNIYFGVKSLFLSLNLNENFRRSFFTCCHLDLVFFNMNIGISKLLWLFVEWNLYKSFEN